MQKAVLMPIQPYYVFLIIARTMGWDVPQEKTIEVRKDFPKDNAWNKVTHIYCSKNRKSFNRIPEQYKPLMKKLLGKVIGEFVCDEVVDFLVFENKSVQNWNYFDLAQSCLTYEEIGNYIGANKKGYVWHISDLKIYEKPKELYDYLSYKKHQKCLELDCFGAECWGCENNAIIVFPPQSWCYVEELAI